MIGNAPFFVVGVLFLMGLVGIFMSKNLIKIAIAVSILGSAVNIFLVALGYRAGGTIPVHFLAGEGTTMVLPTPQAMTLTAIVIALATTALLLSLIMLVWRHYGTLDVDEIRRLRG
ncbi:multicomponent Na+:H+ antiporter subunit C [Aminivibrio pyruvatiphilus]|jgi:multicomponent Na+:H+ antiporter subunit C|uniref:NADH-quinone oxidoreductase subunit K n=1 Tax=Aminivibrio pyruvatiphilus TaxID=1005740 RepID=A0A4R8M372_9BACT|nr:sodium:proton antiporter [Aminivibrio pyruvatiphilus]TDY56727.1 multicomponent Na+:H+ antiporter subunit C [Aminivibrio pyruvatiphilus]